MIGPLALALLAQVSELEPAGMRSDLEALEASVRARWAYLELREQEGLDLAAAFERARGRTGEPLEPEGFAQVLRELVAELQDGHAFVAVHGEVWPPRRLPFELCDTLEGFAVERVASEVEVLAGGAAPRVGELVLALDGRPVEDVHAEAMRRVWASTPGMARSAAFAQMGRLPAERERVEVELEDAGGARRTVTLRAPMGLIEGLDEPAEPERAWALSFPREDVALLSVPSFSPPDWTAWLAADVGERDSLLAETCAMIDERFARLASSGARVLVLDLRGNGGGTDVLGMHLAAHLLPERFTYYRLSAKHKLFGGWGRPSAHGRAPHEHAPPFGGPLVALIDEGCFSVTDNFLRCLDDEREDFTTVGRPSGGGTGAPRALDALPHSGAVVTLCTMRVYGPAGEPIEGRGTRPDVPVVRSRADLAEGRDPDLAAALEWLERELAPEPGAPSAGR